MTLVIIILLISGTFYEILSQANISRKKQIFLEADSLFKAGNRFFEEKQYDSALSAWILSLRGFEHLGEKKAISALLNNLAMVYKQTKDYTNYLHILDRQINYAIAANDLKTKATAEMSLAFYWFDMMDNMKADSLMESALSSIRTIGDKKEIARIQLFAAELKKRKAKFLSALENYEEAAGIYLEQSDSLGYMKAIYGSGLMYLLSGNYHTALHKLEEALSIQLQFNDPKGTADIYNYLGIVYDHLGQIEKAESYFEKAYAIYEKYKVNDGMADVMINQGVLLYNKGQLQKALDVFRQAHQIFESSNNRLSLGKVLTNLSIAYRDMNDLDTALIYINKAIEIERDMRDWGGLAADLAIVANIHWRKTDYLKANRALEEAILIRKLIGDQRGLSNDLIYKGIILLSMAEKETGNKGKDYLDSAMILFLQAHQIKKYIGDFNGEVAALTYLGQIQRLTRKYESALRSLKEAEQLTNTGFANTLRWQIYYELGKTYEKMGDYQAAIRDYMNAIHIIENQRALLQREDFRIGFFKDKTFVYADAIALLYQMKQFSNAFELTERSRSRAFLDILGSKFIQWLQYSEDIYQLDSIETLISEKERSSDQTTRIKELNALLEIRKNLLEKIKRNNEETSSLITITPYPVDSLQTMIPIDQTMLQYYIVPNAVYIFIVNRLKINCVRVEISDSRFYSSIINFRQELKKETTTKYQVYAKSLYQTLIKPALGYIKTERLIIVPHERLHYIPFSALMDEQGKHLIDQYTIQILPAANLLPFIIQKRQAMNVKKSNLSFLGLGNPKVPNMPPLKEAEKEIRSISEMFSQHEIYLDQQATKTVFKKQSIKHSIIHLACHGDFDINDPMNSALLLSRDSLSQGRLTARDLFGINLPNVELVVLSACETGVAKLIKGDELIGLNRAFIYAGALSIVSSLWKVSDKATAELMYEMYKNLDMKNKAGSLRNAQLRMKKTKYYQHPFYWAAFQITGD